MITRKYNSVNKKNPKQPISSQTDLGFVPPQAVELEEAILGALMIEKRAYEQLDSILKPNDFYVESHRNIFKAINSLNESSKPIDMLTVVEELKKTGLLESSGGAVYIAQLTERVSSAAHIDFHAQIIKQKAIERETIDEARKIINRVHENEDIGDVLFESGKHLESLQESLIGKTSGDHISVSLKKALNEMYARIEMARNNRRSGINTGFSDLNRMTNGWQKSDLIILAARPAMGKTAVALHHAKSAAIQGIPVAIFSMEMSDVSLANRLILSEANVDPERFKSGYLTNEEIKSIEQATGYIWKLPIYVDDNPCASMPYIRAKCRVLSKQGKCGMIIGDYLQLTESDGDSGNREQEVAKMSRTAKKIAKELEVPFLLLSQLNRGNETRQDKKPLLSDLRESGAIEQDADMVIFIHRPEYYGIEVTDKQGCKESNYGELIVAKHRNGATGLVKFKHNVGMTKFYDYNSQNVNHPHPDSRIENIKPEQDVPF